MTTPDPLLDMHRLGLDRMTASKAVTVMDLQAMVPSGVVLCCQKTGRRCVVEHGAVRWLDKYEFWALMHPPAADES